LLALTAGIIWLSGRNTPDETSVAVSDSLQTTSSVSSSATVDNSSSVPSSGYVYIAGAVKHPGLYHVKETTRWADVVQAAGGLTKDADPGAVNLAKIARDQENLAVPVKGEGASGATSSNDGGAAGSSTAAAGVTSSIAAINLNTATVTDLQTISGVGPKRAQDIIDYRDQHGGFKSVEELKDISGIGDKIFADIQPNVTVGP
jgi:competence protein ComEA